MIKVIKKEKELPYGKYFLSFEADDEDFSDRPPIKRNTKVIDITPSRRSGRNDFTSGIEELENDDIPEEDTQPPINEQPPVEGEWDVQPPMDEQPPEENEDVQPPTEDEMDTQPPVDEQPPIEGEDVQPPIDEQPPEEGMEDTQPPIEGGEDVQPPMDEQPPEEGGDTQPPMEGEGDVQPPAPEGGEEQPPMEGEPETIDATGGESDDDYTQGAEGEVPPEGDMREPAKKGPGLEYDSTRKYNLFLEFVKLSTSLDNYISKLEVSLGDDRESNLAYKTATDNLRKIKDLTVDFMTMKFELSSYIQSLVFYENNVLMIQLVFDVLNDSLKKIQNKRQQNKH